MQGMGVRDAKSCTIENLLILVQSEFSLTLYKQVGVFEVVMCEIMHGLQKTMSILLGNLSFWPSVLFSLTSFKLIREYKVVNS